MFTASQIISNLLNSLTVQGQNYISFFQTKIFLIVCLQHYHPMIFVALLRTKLFELMKGDKQKNIQRTATRRCIINQTANTQNSLRGSIISLSWVLWRHKNSELFRCNLPGRTSVCMNILFLNLLDLVPAALSLSMSRNVWGIQLLPEQARIMAPALIISSSNNQTFPLWNFLFHTQIESLRDLLEKKLQLVEAFYEG